jgi:hypothetical protein
MMYATTLAQRLQVALAPVVQETAISLLAVDPAINAWFSGVFGKEGVTFKVHVSGNDAACLFRWLSCTR